MYEITGISGMGDFLEKWKINTDQRNIKPGLFLMTARKQ